MANTPISGLNPGGPIQDTDLFPDVQTVGVGPVKVTGAQIKTYTSNSPSFVTPNIGVATGTSLALGGATIGSNALAVTGTADFNSAVTFGTQQSIQGQLVLSNTAAGTFETTLKSSNSSTTAWTFTLPPDSGTNGYILTTNGSGTSAWTNPTALGIDIDVNSTAITGGTNGHLFYDNAGTFGEMSSITTDGAAALTFGTQQTTQGAVVLANTSSGAFPVTLQSSNSTSVAWSFTLPTTAGTNKYALTTDGSGVSSWSQIDLSAAVTGTLPVNHGGTGQTSLAAHGVVIGNSTSGVNVTATGSAGQVLQSGGSSADPSWSTATFPSTATSAGTILRANGTNWVSTTATYPTTTNVNEILYSSANNQVSGLSTANGGVLNTSSAGIPSITANPTLGVQQTTQGSLVLANTAAGAFSTTVKSSNSATEAWTLTLPVSKGTSGYILTTDGTGVSSWTNPTSIGIDIDINSTVITNGTSGRVLYDNAGTVGEYTSVPASQGGTGNTTNTIHGVLIGNAGNAINATSAGSSGQILQSGGASADPTWTTATFPSTASGTGTILRADGTNWSATTATYPTTTSAGTILVSSSSNSVTESSDPVLGVQQTTQGSLVLANTAAGAFSTTVKSSNSASAAWTLTLPTTAGTNNYVLTTNGSGVSSWSQVSLTAGVTGVLPVANGGTGQSTNTIHGVLIGNAGNAVNATSSGSSGQILQSGGASADPTWTTATFPSTATGTGTILCADGTNWSATTATYPTTTSAGTILVSATSNAVTGTATPTLGVAGTTVGTLSFANSTSGSVQLSPTTGALGSSVITMPATTGTMTVLGNTVTGSGNIVLATSPSLTTPTLGVATATSIATGGATISTNDLAINGTSQFTGSVNLGVTSGTETLGLYKDGRNYLTLSRSSTNSPSSVISFIKARGTHASKTIVSSGDNLSSIECYGYDGSANILSASIISSVDGATGLGSVPGRLTFNTTPASTSSGATERMRITSVGDVGIGTVSPASYGAGYTALTLNGTTTGLFDFQSNGARIGTIYNAGTSFFIANSNPNALTFGVNNSEVGRFDSSGNFLIGTTSTSVSKLVVNDNSIQILSTKTPSSATDTGVKGQICWDENYIYVCTATNTWRRSAISSW